MPTHHHTFLVLLPVVLALALWNNPHVLQDAYQVHLALTAEVQLGIDLGTTFSVAAKCTQGNVSVVAVDGYSLTPSVVSFEPPSDVTGQYTHANMPYTVGWDAVDRRLAFPSNTVYAAKRLIGKRFDDAVVELERDSLPYQLVQDPTGNVAINLHEHGVLPETVGQLILAHLKQASEMSLHWLRRLGGFQFASVVVSIPVSFDDDQRRATIRAAEAAGFAQVTLVEEPIAAALAYNLKDEPTSFERDQLRRVLVFDFGGGTLDVAMLLLDKHADRFFVEETSGDPHLGGGDFDVAVGRAVFVTLKEMATPDHIARLDELGDHHHQQQVVVGEAVKKALSSSQVVWVTFDGEYTLAVSQEEPRPSSPDVVTVSISRTQMQQSCHELIERMIKPIEELLDETGVSRSMISDLVLVGGSSKMPIVKETLLRFFPDLSIHSELNPDEAIAIGAAKALNC